jgi:hypothetical protein
LCGIGAGINFGRTVDVDGVKRGASGLYASCEWRHLLVNSSLTLSSTFLLLKDLQRNRLAGRLTVIETAPAPDNCEEKHRPGRRLHACAAAVPAARKR